MNVYYLLTMNKALEIAGNEVDWTFFSNHSHVLVCIGLDPDIRLRDIAKAVGITERSAQRIINHLRSAGILVTLKHGRRNQYFINVDEPLRHPLESHATVGEMLGAVIDRDRVSSLRQQYISETANSPVSSN